jgi:uncharacterized protein YerC
MPARIKVDRAEFARLHEQGWTAKDLAEHFNCNPATVSRLRRTLGVPTQFLTPDRIARIESMLDDGWSFAEIHRTEGVHVETLRNRYPGRAWTMRQRDEHKTAMRYYSEQASKAAYAQTANLYDLRRPNYAA